MNTNIHLIDIIEGLDYHTLVDGSSLAEFAIRPMQTFSHDRHTKAGNRILHTSVARGLSVCKMELILERIDFSLKRFWGGSKQRSKKVCSFNFDNDGSKG